jgi:hypothetical protein
VTTTTRRLKRGVSCAEGQMVTESMLEPRHQLTAKQAKRTHFSLYETTTEGTPLSPVFPSISELAQWCSKNIPLWNGNFGPVYQWEAELRSVFAPARLHGFDAGEREP